MTTRRRGFLRLLAGGIATLAAPRTACRAESPVSAHEIHQATANTRLGALGERMWQASRPVRADPEPANAIALPRELEHQTGSLQKTGSLQEVARRFAATASFSAESVAFAELSRLLHFCNGVTARRAGGGLRAAPSAGALYAGEVYVVALRVEGLAPGIYAYRPDGHGLVLLRAGRFAAQIARALEQPDGAQGAAAAFLLTNVFARYARRYANRAYRYALIDSGHIGENLRLTARSAGLGEVSPLRFHDDQLNALLGVDGRSEAVCALHLVGRPDATRPSRARPAARFVERGRAEPAAVAQNWKVTERFHEATKLVVGEAGAAQRPSAPPEAERLPGDAVSLPDAVPSFRLAVEEAIALRRSAERFDARPVPLDVFAFLLETVRANPALTRSEGVDLLLVVHNVQGLPRGLYRYDGHLARLARADLRTQMIRACLRQRKAGSAAIGVLMVAQLTRSARRAGERSYRDLLIEAGAIGQRIYLAAEAAGLTARNLAAFIDEDLNALAGLDGGHEAVIHLTMVGGGA